MDTAELKEKKKLKRIYIENIKPPQIRAFIVVLYNYTSLLRKVLEIEKTHAYKILSLS